ncbi:MAG: hypothetical protein AAGC56_03670 [Pseudomonadota bacterium]
MRLNHLMSAACAAAITIGFAGAANAGVLTAEVVNANCERNRDNTANANPFMDVNNEGNGNNTTSQNDCRGGVITPLLSADEPAEVTLDDPTVNSSPIQLTDNRIYNADDKRHLTHVEVDLFVDDSGDLGFPEFNGEERLRIDINLNGTSGPEWKKTGSPNTIVRAGRDDLYSESAVGLVNENGNNSIGQFVDGESGTAFFLTPHNNSEAALGFSLPVALTDCGTFSVSIQTTETEGNFNNPRGDDTSTITECAGDSVSGFVMTPLDLTVDIGEEDPFELFLAPDGASGKGFQLSNMSPFGSIQLEVENDVFDLKAKSLADIDAGVANDPRYVDVLDIQEYKIVLGFEDLSGIGSVTIECDGGGSEAATLDVGADTATWTLSGAEIVACFAFEGDAIIDDGNSQTYTGEFKIMSSEDAPIVTQHVDLIEHSVLFDQTLDGNPMWQLTPVQLEEAQEDIFRIVRSGLNFGPFDWSTSEGMVNSVFRVSGLPELGPQPDDLPEIDAYEGIIFIGNSSKGKKGFCEFEADFIVHGEGLFTKARLAEILSDDANCKGDSALEDFGRADLTFSWYVPLAIGDQVDMDRLLNTNSTFAGYGDNGNDAFSLKARSCDAGRFGPHVANNLSGTAADILTFVCGLGEAQETN